MISVFFFLHFNVFINIHEAKIAYLTIWAKGSLTEHSLELISLKTLYLTTYQVRVFV